ncbi:(Fe-S)-binding protein [Solimonas terrae]|uniref:Glycolate oxidase iron-sulfur subunit n=1 Tax=Solimonas terrae TaxID=1396819 RepID=A0A6M2BWK3_9GAMM|nr:heterodisulfide reductase-related iron-sulfur binding cluster [Solimonas terrae]NGY06976.1 4Fe-4S dicluster domain-containing protein [Solimonas terrae]
MPESQAAALFPLAKADLCVKCGLCLPHCPTYQETRHEAESPRGRIMLMQGLASGMIEDSAPLQAHLDRCLGCRSCERVCPAKVPYGELIDAGRAMLVARRGSAPRLTRWLAPWLTSAGLRRVARTLLAIYQRSGLQGLVALGKPWRMGRVGRLASLIPQRSQAIAVGNWRVQARRQPVQLFGGCVGDIADSATLKLIKELLERCGFEVQTPSSQTCCGALHQHAGVQDQARQLVARNVRAFSGNAPILYAASGCGATLKEYALIAQGDGEAAAMAGRVADPHRFLLDHWPSAVSLRELDAKIAVHLPCTQRNVTGDGEAVSALLRKIPGARVEPLDLQHNCCGAAGTYFVSQPEMADRLLEHKLDALAAAQPDILVSSNIGCSLHIAAGLRRRGLRVPVLHPLALLAQQWPSDM